MRSEKEIMDLVLETARQDERIRVVMLNGSRANPAAPRDCFQDFDILFLVTDMAPFRHRLDWIQRFGELMILQLPDEMVDPPPDGNSGYTYLMQFMDGNRIDLGIQPLDKLDDLIQDDLGVLLLDKDGIVDPSKFPAASFFFPQPPTAKAFDDCCNDFWWVCPYVAKGLWRDEYLYARSMLEKHVRKELMKMLTWYAGLRTGFNSSPGKEGKYLRQLLEPETWQQLLRTYSDAGVESTWQALFIMGDLFRRTAQAVAEGFGFRYPRGDDDRVSHHLRHVHTLPADAKGI
jgi:aminoglycoside 6-adenylyltransferase